MHGDSSTGVVSVLIGFKYHGNHHNRQTLPSTEIDLYMMRNMATQMKSDKIIIITDLVENPSTSKYTKMIVEGKVDDKILTMIDDMKSCGQYFKYSSWENASTLISSATKNATKVFFYMSCHGIEGNMLLPVSGAVVPSAIRKVAIPRSDPNLNCFIVMDCCESTGLSLPFVYKGRDYRTNTLDNIIQSKVILVTSSTIGTKSVSRSRGSDFTVELVKMMKKTKSVAQIFSSIECMSVFSTFPEFRLWGWIYGVSINAYVEDNCIVIERT